ncbi:uroporphyrinogen-III synthase [Bordetella bronchiseptica]|nr:uroporphyrinogen-III synthase [Bordetella genomosp. 6]
MSQIAILTRPQGRNGALARRLRDAGWQTLCLPALRIEPLPPENGVVPLPRDYDLVVFVSGNAARLYLEQLRARGQLPWPAGALAATVGPASARALLESGHFGADTTVLHPAESAPTHDSEALWALLRARPVLPRRALLIRGTQGRDWLADRLAAAGVEVSRHAVYRRLPAPWAQEGRQRLRDWARAGERPTWLLTSGEGIDALVQGLREEQLLDWWLQGRFVVTHPVLAERLRALAGGGAGAPMVKNCMPADEAIFATFVAA